jgi:hypothetical protein
LRIAHTRAFFIRHALAVEGSELQYSKYLKGQPSVNQMISEQIDVLNAAFTGIGFSFNITG